MEEAVKKINCVKKIVKKFNDIEYFQSELARDLEIERAKLEYLEDEITQGQISARKELDQIHEEYTHAKRELQALKGGLLYRYYMLLPESEYERELKYWYEAKTGRALDLKNPQTYNEKIQWLKLYDCTPVKTRLADKYLVREYVKEKIGAQYLIPILGVWDSFDEIDFDSLPNQFVLKANHGCGWNIIVKDKSTFELTGAKAKFELWMHRNFAFMNGFELQYKNITPKIIAEQYIGSGEDLVDYKMSCFHGEVRYIWVDSERFTAHKRDIFNIEWELQPFRITYDHAPLLPAQPKNLQKMIELATKLSENFLHVRIDFYDVNGTVYLGELTFTSESGVGNFIPPVYDQLWGELLHLPGEQIR